MYEFVYKNPYIFVFIVVAYKQTYIYRLEDEMWTTSMEEKERKEKKERFGSLRIGSHYDLVYITN